MENDEIREIRNATGEAIDCLFELRDAAESYQAGVKRQSGPRFIKTAYRLEASRDALFNALSRRFDAFAAVATDLVPCGPIATHASAHEALYTSCGIIISEMAGAIVRHHCPNPPPSVVMPSELPTEADFIAAIEPAVQAFLNVGISGHDINGLSGRLQQEYARIANTGTALPPAVLPAATENDARNKWLYEKCCALVKFDSIIRQLAEKNTWEPLESRQGVKRAANSYAKAHNLSLIPSRQPGRTRRKK